MSNVLLTMVGFFVVVVCGACGGYYKPIETAPPSAQAKLREVEQGYHDVAGQKAAFLANCPKDQVKTETVARTPQDTWLPNHGWVRGFQRIASIGASGCDKRFLFQLVCRDQQSYTRARDVAACEVVQDGGAALVAAEASQQESLAEQKKREEESQQNR